MSSGFVSAGGEDNKPREGLSEYDADAWTKARQKIEELKKPQPEAPGTQEGGKSLYEHLQAQKAAKQEAFEEATKLRNQFRPLDDSEVDFLESIKRREKDEATTVRKETEEQLALFRKERAAAEEKAREQESKQEADQDQSEQADQTWTTTKKRRRADVGDKSAGTKSLKTSASSHEAQPPVSKATVTPLPENYATESTPMRTISEASQPSVTTQTASKVTTTLVAYDSDSDG